MEPINFKHLPFANSASTERSKPNKPPLAVVDSVVDGLVKEYDNPKFRQWYCGVVYEFGLDKVEEWRKRACEGNSPAKLFSSYVKQARTYHSVKHIPEVRDESK